MASYTGNDKRLAYLFQHGGGGGGGDANIWYGTMAEYLQQASQIDDGTTVIILDDEEQAQAYQIYTENETVIGSYLGKPLYRKVVTGLNVTAAWQQQYYPNVAIPAPIANVKEVINSRAIMNYNNGISRNSICSIIVNNTNSTWALIVFDDITINTLIVEYTKTTD